MSTKKNVLAILSASIEPLTAREIRKALGDTDSPEKIGGALSDLERRGQIIVIRDERPYIYTT